MTEHEFFTQSVQQHIIDADRIRSAAFALDTHCAVRPVRRRASVVLLVAVAFLLTACAAVAAYRGAMRRAKDKAREQSELPQAAVAEIAEDTLRQERGQDMALADRVVIPVSGEARMADATLTLTGLEQVFGYNADREIALTYVYIHFDVESSKVRFMVSLDAEETAAVPADAALGVLGLDSGGFTLTADGQNCPIYQSTTGEPPIYRTEQGDFCARFISDRPIEAGVPLCFAGTLHAYDGAGNIVGELGAFSVSFAYDRAAFDACIQQKIDRYGDVLAQEYRQNAARLDAVPENAVPVGLSVDGLTVEDVAWRDDLLYLGLRREGTREALRAQAVDVYIDGYLVPSETVGALVWEDASAATDIRQAKLPIALERMPADGREAEAWLSAQRRAESDGRNAAHAYAVHAVQTINGTSLTITRIRFAEDGTVEVGYRVENVACETMAWETEPAVTIHGRLAGSVLSVPSGRDGFTVDIADFMHGRTLQKNRFLDGAWYAYGLERISELPEAFRVDIAFDLYDLNLRGERTLVGTYRFSVPIDKSREVGQP